MIQVPGSARFPIELRPPPDFRPDDERTWPKVPGRMEFVRGRLLYMTPCGDVQSEVVLNVSFVLVEWLNGHADYTGGTNEAGMILGGDVRGADAALWRRADLGPMTGGYRRVAPVLAVEVAGREEEEGEGQLREKAGWYLAQGVAIVWLVLPDAREVLVLQQGAETRRHAGERLDETPDLPGLAPDVDRFFRRLR